MFFGCQTRDMNLYEEEKADMVKAGVLDRVFLALSREPNIPKVSGSHSNLSISLMVNYLSGKEMGILLFCIRNYLGCLLCRLMYKT